MPATTTRQEALERICKTFHDALERVIPADENQRLQGNNFRDFELQVQAFKAALIPVLLEERARLTESAELKEAGCCPHCGSHRTRWIPGMNGSSMTTLFRKPVNPSAAISY